MIRFTTTLRRKLMVPTALFYTTPDGRSSLPHGVSRTTAGLLLAVMFAVPPAAADQIRIITSGGADQIVDDGETAFRFIGSGFEFNGEWSALERGTCYPCAPGSTLDLSATLAPSVYSAGAATLEGRRYDSIYFGGNFDFDAGSVTIPAVASGGSPVYPTSTFTFTGTLAGYADASLSGTPLFSTLLQGSGTARIGFFNYGQGITADGLAFTFEDAAPTPEPASMILFASGAAWLAARRRSRNGGRPDL